MRGRASAYPAAAAAAALFWLPAAARGAEGAPGAEAPDLFTATLKMVSALVLLLAGLLLGLYFLRRLSAARGGLFRGQEVIRLIATRALGPKKFIAVVEVGGSVLTLGVTNENISCLDKVGAEEFEQNGAVRPPEPTSVGGFARRLKALAVKGPVSPEEEAS